MIRRTPPVGESPGMAEQSRATAEAPEAGELPAAEPARVPARRDADELRDYLPGVETERQVTDWGRSERVEGLLDRTVVEFFYRYWFRVEVEGVENVPAEGGALLVSNHAGALPPDAPMIVKAIREEHPRPRPVHLTVEHFFKGYPLFSMLVAKIGGVPAHPANVHRLLYFPITPTFPHLGLAGMLGYLPAKFRIRFLEPIETDGWGAEPWHDAGLVQTVAEEVRARIQEELYDMLAHRRSVWFG